MGRNISVLVVEDNAQNMTLMRDLLQVQGYHVLEAEDGMKGWELAREHHPDLILMDIQLPDVSGVEVTKWLKNDETLRTIPVVAVTAFAMKGDEENFLAAGCDGYISKPISVSHFLQTLKRFLGGLSGNAPRAPASDIRAGAQSDRK
jgi:two-component system, cell cycle response regulator DivK